MPEATPTKPKRSRSPNYPGISLKEAVERAESFYGHAKRFPVPASDALLAWGFSPTSGTGGVVLGALKQFGLTVDEGSGEKRHIRLSPLALDILLHEPAAPERTEAIQRAFLTPPIYRQLWTEFEGAMPPESTLRFKLIRERGFTEGGADYFIRQLKESVAFAEIEPGPVEAPQIADDTADAPRPDHAVGSGVGSTTPTPSAKPTGSPRRAFSLPLPRQREVLLHVPDDLDETDWNLMMTVLTAMKPGIVIPSSASE